MSNSTTEFACNEIDEYKLSEIKRKIIQKNSSYTESHENDTVLENIIKGYLILEKSYNSFINFCNLYESMQNELVEELSDRDKFTNTSAQILRNAIVLVQMYKFIENGQRYSPFDLNYQLDFNVRTSPPPPIGYTGFGCDDFTNRERRKTPNIQKLQELCYKGKNQRNAVIREQIIEKYFNLLNIIPNEVTDNMNKLKKRISCLTFSNDLSEITFAYQGRGENSIPTCIVSPIMNYSRKRHTIPNWSQAQWQHFLRNCYTIMKAVPLKTYHESSNYIPTLEERQFTSQINNIGKQKKTVPIIVNKIIKQKRTSIKKTKHESDDDDDNDVFCHNNQSAAVLRKSNLFYSDDEVNDGSGDGDVAGGADNGGAGDEHTEESKIGQDEIACHDNPITSILTISNPGGGGGDSLGGGGGGGEDDNKESKSDGVNDAEKMADHDNPITSIPNTSNPGGGSGGSGGGEDNDGDDDDDNESKKGGGEMYVTSLLNSNISDIEKDIIGGYMQEEILENLKKELQILESQQDKADAITRKEKELREFTGERLMTHVTDTGGPFHLNRESLLSLRPNMWLNDEVINLYNNCPPLFELANKQDSMILNTHYYSTLMDEKNTNEYTFKAVTKWKCFKDRSPLMMTKVYIPINQGNQHWVLVVIDNPSKTITLYDSLLGKESLDEKTGEIKSKYNKDILGNIMRLLKEYDQKVTDYRYTCAIVPRQKGGEFMNLCIYLSCHDNSLTL